MANFGWMVLVFVAYFVGVSVGWSKHKKLERER